MNRALFLISYDIADDKRRNKMSRFLEDYGYRVQKSVFECFLTPEMYEKVYQEIRLIMNEKEDRVRVYKVCRSCRKRAAISGFAEVPEEEEFVVV
ncbi:MAG: CRISPR-associated endonuclease Cas2 [Candidatus Desulfofervidaceae bacterium]|nr:CRISPR-associated endonuclease Cas2 [Candidatus Desulfofervidaceae bacterium]